jgi:hypothetical protein
MISRTRLTCGTLPRAMRALALACLAAIAAPAQIVIDDPIPPPVFSPAAAAFLDTLVITMAAPTPGAAILFTLDGSIPTHDSPRYAAPIVITATTVVKAVAIRNAQRSMVVSAVYVRSERVATPVASVGALDRLGNPIITLSTATSGATILYTLDGRTPDAGSILYAGPFVIDRTATLKAIAIKPPLVASSVLVETYTLPGPAPSAPAISPFGGAFLDSLRVVLDHPDPSARLLYTLDGSDPTFASPLLRPGQAVLIRSSATMKVIAVKGDQMSAMVVARFERSSAGIRDRAGRTGAVRLRPARTWEREGRRLDGARR